MISAFGITHGLSKSYVGAGAYRSVSELTPQARKVLLRRVRGARKFRTSFGDEGRPMPQSRNNELWARERQYNTETNKTLITARKLQSRKTRKTSIKNLSVGAKVKPRHEKAIVRSYRGVPLKRPTTVHTKLPKTTTLPQGWGAANIPTAGGPHQVVLPAKQDRLKVGALQPRIVNHELAHAGPKRKGRFISMMARKSPTTSMAREEARADATAERLSTVRRKRMFSEYPEGFRGRQQKAYDDLYTKLAGRKPKSSLSNNGKNLKMVSRQIGTSRTNVLEAAGGTKGFRRVMDDARKTSASPYEQQHRSEVSSLRRSRRDKWSGYWDEERAKTLGSLP